MRLFLALVVCASFAPAQIQVSGGGAALQAAVTAAPPGSTLLVSSGTYDGFVASRGVRILCDPGTTITDFGGAVVLVENLPADETFVLHGAMIFSQQLTANAFVRETAGFVSFESVTGNLAGGVLLSNCARCAFHDCSFVSISGTGSAVSVVDCRSSSLDFGFGATRLSVSQLSAGSFPVSGLPLIRVGGGGEILLSGDGSSGYFVSADGGTLRVRPDVLVRSMVFGTAAIVPQDVPTVSASPLRPGTMFTATTRGTPGQVAGIVLGVPSPVVPLPIGDYWAGAFTTAIASGTYSASGTLSNSLLVPSMLGIGESFVLQGATIDAAGSLQLSPALAAVVH